LLKVTNELRAVLGGEFAALDMEIVGAAGALLTGAEGLKVRPLILNIIHIHVNLPSPSQTILVAPWIQFPYESMEKSQALKSQNP
jgi:hypothetical protein